MNEQVNTIYVKKKSTTTNKQKFLLHILETEVIILSSFPKPLMGKFGYIYEIPRVHCKIKECQIDDCSTNGSKETKTSCNRGTEYQRVFLS